MLCAKVPFGHRLRRAPGPTGPNPWGAVMSSDFLAGTTTRSAEPVFPVNFGVAPPPPPAPAPAAQAKPGRVRIQTQPDEEPNTFWEELLAPRTVRGWAVSL